MGAQLPWIRRRASTTSRLSASRKDTPILLASSRVRPENENGGAYQPSNEPHSKGGASDPGCRTLSAIWAELWRLRIVPSARPRRMSSDPRPPSGMAMHMKTSSPLLNARIRPVSAIPSHSLTAPVDYDGPSGRADLEDRGWVGVAVSARMRNPAHTRNRCEQYDAAGYHPVGSATHLASSPPIQAMAWLQASEFWTEERQELTLV